MNEIDSKDLRNLEISNDGVISFTDSEGDNLYCCHQPRLCNIGEGNVCFESPVRVQDTNDHAGILRWYPTQTFEDTEAACDWEEFVYIP